MSTISEPIIPSITSSSFLPHSSSPSSPSLDPSKTCIQVVQTEQSLLENDSTTPGVRETLSNNSSSSPKLSPSNPDHHDQNLSSKRKRDGPSHKLNLSKSAKLDNQSLSNSTCNLDIQDLGFDPFHPHPGMTKDQRKLARMIRNRTAAQASRDRKKEHVAELENRVKELESQLEVALSRQHKCPRPCCRVTDEPLVQASSSMIDPAVVASSLSARIHAVPVHPNNSIDPSIIRLGRSNLVSQSGKEIEPDFLNALDATSRELISHGSVTTLSPAQSEYLSQARIHILEEENTQLKSQLEFELKKAQQLRVRSINNNFQGLTSETLESDALDIGGSLVKLILGDQKLTNTNCDPLSDKSKIVSKFSSPSEELDPQSSELKSNEILDWNSLLSEPSCLATNPRSETELSNCTSTSNSTSVYLSDKQSTSDIKNGINSNSIEFMRDPVTPSNKYQSQTPSSVGSSSRDDPSTTDSIICPNRTNTQSGHRLVAREITNSQQRKDLTKEFFGIQARTSVSSVTIEGVIRLCPLLSLTVMIMMSSCFRTKSKIFGSEMRKHPCLLEMKKVCYFCWVALIALMLISLMRECRNRWMVQFMTFRKLVLKILRNHGMRVGTVKECLRMNSLDSFLSSGKNEGAGFWRLLRMREEWTGRVAESRFNSEFETGAVLNNVYFGAIENMVALKRFGLKPFDCG